MASAIWSMSLRGPSSVVCVNHAASSESLSLAGHAVRSSHLASVSAGNNRCQEREETLIRGIRKVAPGHLLEWRQGKVHSQAWWKIPEGAKRRISLGAAKEELDWLLQDAVREHLIADVPLG